MMKRLLLLAALVGVIHASAGAQATQFVAPGDQFTSTFKKLPPEWGWGAWEARMPSAIQTPFAPNNTITVYGFEPVRPSRAAAIVLPIANGKNLMLEKAVAMYLASQGIVGVVMPMPYQFDRGKDARSANAMDLADEKKGLGLFMQGSEQAVSDVRRVRQWLIERRGIDAEKVGLVGISLGSIIASVTYSVDKHFSAAVLVLCGGDLADVVWHGSRETRELKDAIIGMGHDLAWTRRILRPLDPLTYANAERGKGVLMINARSDEVFPAACTMKLAHAYGDPEMMMLPGNHYSVAVFLPVVLKRAGEFLRGRLVDGPTSGEE